MATITPTGVRGTTLSEYQVRLNEALNAALGGNLALDPETPQGQLIGVLAIIFTEIDQAIVATANGLDIQTATGFQLDALCSILGVTRNDALHSRGLVTFTGTEGTAIPPSTVITDEDGILSVGTLSVGSVVIGASGSVDIFCEHRYPGPVVIAASQLNRLASPINGVTGVHNRAPFLVGADRETDKQYRERYFRSIGRIAKGTVDSALNAILNVNGVESLRIEENRSATAVSPRNDGVTIDGNSIMFIIVDNDNEIRVGETVQPAIDPDLEESIGNAIALTLPAGTNTSGAASITLDNGQTVRYQRAEPLRIGITYSINIRDGFPADGLASIGTNLIDYVDQLNIGDGIEDNALFQPLYRVPGHIVSGTPIARRLPIVHELATDNANPTGIAVDGDTVFVLDSEGDASTAGKVYMYDKNFVPTSNESFDLNAANTDPSGIAIRDDYAWVLDKTLNQIFVYNISDLSSVTFNSPAIDLDSTNTLASGIFVTNGHVYVVDDTASSERVFIYTKATTTTISGTPTALTLAEGNNQPSGIIVTSDSSNTDVRVYITGDEIYVYDPAVPGTGTAATAYPLENLQLDENNDMANGLSFDNDFMYVLNTETDSNQVYAYAYRLTDDKISLLSTKTDDLKLFQYLVLHPNNVTVTTTG